MIREDNKYLSLAIPVDTYFPGEHVLSRFFSMLQTTSQNAEAQ